MLYFWYPYYWPNFYLYHLGLAHTLLCTKEVFSLPCEFNLVEEENQTITSPSSWRISILLRSKKPNTHLSLFVLLLFPASGWLNFTVKTTKLCRLMVLQIHGLHSSDGHSVLPYSSVDDAVVLQVVQALLTVHHLFIRGKRTVRWGTVSASHC